MEPTPLADLHTGAAAEGARAAEQQREREANAEAAPEVKALQFMLPDGLRFTAFDWSQDPENGDYICIGYWGSWSEPPTNVVSGEARPVNHVVIRDWFALELKV